MKVRAGYRIAYDCAQPTPMILTLSVHPDRRFDLITEDKLTIHPFVPITEYGRRLRQYLPCDPRATGPADAVIRVPRSNDSGEPDVVAPLRAATVARYAPRRHASSICSAAAIARPTGSSDIAWSKFGKVRKGWGRVQAICDFVNEHVFGYKHAHVGRTAYDTYIEKRGVCRDFAHLAVTFCRCMNIPARYCTGYLGDIGMPPDPCPMDFSAWFEVFLDGTGTRSTRATTCRALAASSSPAGATPPMWPSPPRLARTRSPRSRSSPTR